MEEEVDVAPIVPALVLPACRPWGAEDGKLFAVSAVRAFRIRFSHLGSDLTSLEDSIDIDRVVAPLDPYLRTT